MATKLDKRQQRINKQQENLNKSRAQSERDRDRNRKEGLKSKIMLFLGLLVAALILVVLIQ